MPYRNLFYFFKHSSISFKHWPHAFSQFWQQIAFKRGCWIVRCLLIQLWTSLSYRDCQIAEFGMMFLVNGASCLLQKWAESTNHRDTRSGQTVGLLFLSGWSSLETKTKVHVESLLISSKGMLLNVFFNTSVSLTGVSHPVANDISWAGLSSGGDSSLNQWLLCDLLSLGFGWVIWCFSSYSKTDAERKHLIKTVNEKLFLESLLCAKLCLVNTV